MERRVLLVPESVIGKDVEVCSIEGRQFLLTKDVILEMYQMQRKLGSWFVEDSVASGGGMLFVGTLMDPVFLVLPELVKSKHQVNEKK